MRKLMCFTILITGVMRVAASNYEFKNAIKTAASSARSGWMKSRAKPVAVGAAMVVVPPTIAIGSFLAILAKSGTGMTSRESDLLGAALVLGGLASYVLVPLGSMLIGRQTFLVNRDVRLLNKFTKSTTQLNPKSLPDVKTIRAMNTHHQLLSLCADYVRLEGNDQECRSLTMLGFRGFDYKRVK